METLFIGCNTIFLDEVGSTNSYAIELLKNVNPPEGTVIHTHKQTRGKGQRGNAWKTQPQSNLTASVILKPSFLTLKNQFYLSKITALACYDLMAEFINPSQFDIKIKWPNDILVNKKKIGGILIENTYYSQKINHSVIGVGLNINQTNFESSLNATSLKILSNNNTPLNIVLNKFCKHLEVYFLKLRNNKFEEIDVNYLNKLYAFNTWQKFIVNDKENLFYVKSITEDGLLELEDELKQVFKFELKQIKWVF